MPNQRERTWRGGLAKYWANKGPGICPACDAITFHPERHLISNCEAEQDLSNDT